MAGVLDGRRYNRVVRFHKLMYEALLRLAWKGFPSWLKTSHQDKQHIVQDIAEALSSLSANLCQKEAQEVLENPQFSNLIEILTSTLITFAALCNKGRTSLRGGILQRPSRITCFYQLSQSQRICWSWKS